MKQEISLTNEFFSDVAEPNQDGTIPTVFIHRHVGFFLG